MTKVTIVGLDLAKSVFQVHGADKEGRPVVRKKLRRGQVLAFFAGLSPCLIGLEACASAHYWARKLRALGHAVRLIPPQYVHPFVKTNKNDATDAEAICKALMRPTMRFAAVKSAEQQSVLMLHRARDLLVRQRTMLINALRGHCGEFGMVVAQGASKVTILIEMIEDRDDARLPALAAEFHRRDAVLRRHDQVDGGKPVAIPAARQDRCVLRRSKCALPMRSGHRVGLLITKSARSSADYSLS